MKKVLLALVALVAFSSSVSAQEYVLKRLDFKYANGLSSNANASLDTIISSTAENLYVSFDMDNYPIELIIIGDIIDLNNGEGVTVSYDGGANGFILQMQR